jgi:NadR type nicotinamide-nucleotide adenylyltransferase
MKETLARVVVVGPESTGKSTLSERLSIHYGTLWCPEYARSFLHEHGGRYDYESLLQIARGQLDLEERFAERAVAEWSERHPDSRSPRPLLFVDTDMYVMKVWCEFVYGRCHPWILDRIAERRYDLYLLCHTDLPWVSDELREYPDPVTRMELFRIYRDHMANQPVPWADITGSETERLAAAVAAVDSILVDPIRTNPMK